MVTVIYLHPNITLNLFHEINCLWILQNLGLIHAQRNNWRNADLSNDYISAL